MFYKNVEVYALLYPLFVRIRGIREQEFSPTKKALKGLFVFRVFPLLLQLVQIRIKRLHIGVAGINGYGT